MAARMARNGAEKRNEERGRAEACAEGVVETLPEPLLVLDRNLRVIFANPSFYRTFRARPEETQGHFFSDVGNRQWDIPRLRILLGQILPKNAQFQDFKIKYELEPIGERRMALSARPIYRKGKRTEMILLAIADVTEQKQAAEELRRLTAQLLEVQEEDRRQVAYDIHDGLGQMITAASMHLESFSRYHREGQSKAGEEFAKAKRCLGDAVVEMRRMVSELGPLLLEDVGLVEASRRLLAEIAERQSWETEFEGEMNVESLDPMAEMALFRIVQEALANAAKHSQTQKMRIAFRRKGDALLLEVRDWGKGFDVDQVLGRSARGRHVGLLGMRERAALSGGQFKIESAPGKGTRVVVTLPVAPATAPVIGRKKVEVVGMTEARKNRDPSAGAITVLIADDHPMVREGLRSMLDAEGIEIIGEAATGTEAVGGVQQLNPDVVLMDVRMPDMDGLTATEIIKQGSPETSIIVITSYESKDYLRRAIEAGAAGYLLKGMSRESLIEAIHLVRGGGSLIDARLLSDLLREMGVQESRFRGAEGALEALTPREQEVLQFLVRGLTNKEIASEMHYSVGTIKNVVQRVIEKLGVSDRTQAAVYAVRAGLDSPPQRPRGQAPAVPT